MKQAIYIFILYIGVVTFFTLSYFGQGATLSLAISLLAMLGTGAAISAANKGEEKGYRVNY